MSEWIKTSDRLPAELKEYNVMIKGAFTATTLTFDPKIKAFIDEDEVTYRVSHWQPLPEPPKEIEVHCCFCGNLIDGHSNNAAPAKEGTCCDVCNMSIVVPLRIAAAKRCAAKEVKS